MEKSSTISEELKELSPVLYSVSRENIYQLPEGYFEHLTAELSLKIGDKVQEMGERSTPMKVPELYFDTLSHQILQKVKVGIDEIALELAEIAPVLSRIERKDHYTIPDGYLENLSYNSQKPEKSKLISFRTTSRWFSFAAAAVIALVLVSGSFLMNNSTATKLDFSKELNQISDSELSSYIDSDLVVSIDETNFYEQDVPDVKQAVKVLSDDDLQQYLKETEPIGKSSN